MSEQPSVTVLSNTSLLLDATQLRTQDTLAIQKKIWSLTALCKESPDFIDVVAAMNSLTVYLKCPSLLNKCRNDLLQLWQQSTDQAFKGKEHRILTRYDAEHGPDLEYLTNYHNITPQKVIEIHSQAIYQVLFLGFQPGFAYLHGLSEQLTTPRRSKPRTRVPKGSVAIGANQTAIYPADSPGGWHIIGHTNHPLFDTSKETPCTIAPGDTLKFVVED